MTLNPKEIMHELEQLQQVFDLTNTCNAFSESEVGDIKQCIQKLHVELSHRKDLKRKLDEAHQTLFTTREILRKRRVVLFQISQVIQRDTAKTQSTKNMINNLMNNHKELLDTEKKLLRQIEVFEQILGSTSSTTSTTASPSNPPPMLPEFQSPKSVEQPQRQPDQQQQSLAALQPTTTQSILPIIPEHDTDTASLGYGEGNNPSEFCAEADDNGFDYFAEPMSGMSEAAQSSEDMTDQDMPDIV